MPGDAETGHRGRLVLAVVLVGLAWGTMYALYPIGLQRSGPVWLAALRFDAFFLGALAVVLWRRVPVRPAGGRDAAAIAAYAGLNVIAHNLLLMTGTKHVPVAVVGMTAGLNPVLTLVLARFALPGVRLSGGVLGGLALGLAGVGVLAWQGGTDGRSVDAAWAAVVLGGVLAWSAGSVAMKASRSTLSPLALALWGSLAGAVVLQVAAIAVEPLPAVDGPYLATIAFSGLVGGLGAFLLWGGVVRDFGPERANLASYVSPVAASLAAFMLVGQPLRPVHAVAYALVAAGLALSLPRAARTAPVAAAPE